MKHLDEHTMTDYVLGSPLIRAQEEAIRAHLAECHGCRSLHAEIRAYYSEVQRELETREADGEEVSGTLQTVSYAGHLHRQRIGGAPVRPAARGLRKVYRMRVFIYQHPVSSGASAVVFALLAFFSARSVVDRISVPENPVLARVNQQATFLEVCSRENKILWQLPVVDASLTQKNENEFKLYTTQVVDLDGDGTNEVVTGLSVKSNSAMRDGALRIFNADGKIRHERRMGHFARFRGVDYVPEYSIAGILVRTSRANNEKELLAGSRDARSPSCLTRLDHEGNILGEYWHFGHLNALYKANVPGNEGKGVVLCGVNDVADQADSSYPAVVVLDPEKVTGTTESLQTPGFGFPPSTAEVYYISFPRPNLDGMPDLITNKAGFDGMEMGQDSSLTFICVSGTADKLPHFFFTFDKTFQLKSVWVDSVSRRLLLQHHPQLTSERELQEYLAALKNGVRYWTGSTWVKEVTRIKQA